ncbi:hypothetical protein [Lactiplantibacillus carotarum]|uniref:hypothetical protein n=1 Tax=Lactiplantibacillus carotarum TaxID=2993456 RepID=UPI00298F2AF6|nr:hypothetical protein [Lactiplantibacillus carotarum]
MSKRQLGTLMAVNLRLLNPQVTTRARKSGVTGRQLTRKLINQFFSMPWCFSLFTVYRY